ncbi:MAG: hypothetical protein PHD73_03505 [Sediminibacterium sp.]|nr:hypothetical protein [Sediminibacterium sp.]
MNWRNEAFLAWKQAGPEESIWFGKMENKGNTPVAASAANKVPGANTNFAPSLVLLNGTNYVFWINPDGRIQYVVVENSQTPAFSTVYELPLTGSEKFSQGLSITSFDNRLILATHTDRRDELFYAVLEQAGDGRFKETVAEKIPNARSKNYPRVVTLNKQQVRFCWTGKGDLIQFADFDLLGNIWSPVHHLTNKVTAASPAIQQPGNEHAVLYIWRGNRKDTRMYYKLSENLESNPGQSELPVYFSSSYSAALSKTDNNHLVMAYTSLEGKLMVSSLINYQPAKWMEQMIGPAGSNKTLKDIVIPGSHDAGMSVLTATGGQQKGTINDCNTLTQKLNIAQQLNAGIRMFDFRAGTYNKLLYTKHASSDCMEDALGGGYGERLFTVASAIKQFLATNREEIVLATFSHFCEKETPLQTLKDSLVQWIGSDLIYTATKSTYDQVPLSELAGKVILSFEVPLNPDNRFPTCSIADQSAAFINFRRAYAATNNLNNLLDKEKAFFTALSSDSALAKNDMIRLDWQLTQSNDEAPVICNEFEDDKINPLVNGVLLLTNVIRKNKSIINHAIGANAVLPVKLNEWISDGIINKQNKPHILYVDVAGTWITDYCINLLRSDLYNSLK